MEGILWHLLVHRDMAVIYLLLQRGPVKLSPLSISGLLCVLYLLSHLELDVKIQMIPTAQCFSCQSKNLALIKPSDRSLRIDFPSYHQRSKFDQYSIWQHPVSFNFVRIQRPE